MFLSLCKLEAHQHFYWTTLEDNRYGANDSSPNGETRCLLSEKVKKKKIPALKQKKLKGKNHTIHSVMNFKIHSMSCSYNMTNGLESKRRF